MEILAPAGDIESFEAAINAGANAVYIGGKLFSARAYAANFEKEEIAKMITSAHIRGVKVYVTCNTLLFENEFMEAVKYIDYLYHHDVDAILIQDLGLANYLHQVYPSLPLHASTQLNCHNLSQAKSLIKMGFSRIVLGREVSLEKVKQIKALGVEVEVFVHGALCVSYSGNCYMSSFIGKRSGNRGKCAQPCRLASSITDLEHDYGNYALSTKDLFTLDHINDLVDAKIDSLKIEGRMKRPEYVYQVVDSYSRALKAAINHRPFDYNHEKYEMLKLFNRDFTKGYLFNESITNVLNQNTSNHQGVYLGRVSDIKGNSIIIQLDAELRVGDGIRFLSSRPSGTTVSSIIYKHQKVNVGYPKQTIAIFKDDHQVKIGDEVRKTTDSKQLFDINEKMQRNKKVKVDMNFFAILNKPLKLTVDDNEGNVVTINYGIALQAKNSPTSSSRIKEQLSKLGDSFYQMNEFKIYLEDNLFINIKDLNEIRRQAIQELNVLRANKNHYEKAKTYEYKQELINAESKDTFTCSAIVDNEEQLLTALEFPLKNIYVNDYSLYQKYMDKYRVHYFHSRVDSQDNQMAIKDEMLSYFKDSDESVACSPYMNVTNSYALDFLFQHHYSHITLSLENSHTSIEDMLTSFKERNGFSLATSYPIYGRFDLMLIKSCPIATSLKINRDHCGTCFHKQFYLKDRINKLFPLKRDKNCNNRVLNADTLYLFDKLELVKQCGIKDGLVIFTLESKKEVLDVLNNLFATLKGEINPIELEDITNGHFMRGIE